jgi:hypothetical protein
MKQILSIYWVLAAAIWYFANGILHDIFVLIRHKDGYNRELLRLLMDGHLLILSGIISFVCYLMILNKVQYGPLIGIVVAASMIVYCFMIFPFLKSFVTLGISILMVLVCLRYFYVS